MILLVRFMDFPKLLESIRIYASWTVGFSHLLVKRKMTECNMISLNFASYYFRWCFIMMSLFNVLCQVVHFVFMCGQPVE